MRTKAGVGGIRSGLGSKKRGSTVDGVGVVSCDVEPVLKTSAAARGGVGVSGDITP